MEHKISETYRGYQLMIELTRHEVHGVTLRCRIDRRLGQRLAVAHEVSETVLRRPSENRQEMADALRNAREAVDRLLGGWHPVYVENALAQGTKGG